MTEIQSWLASETCLKNKTTTTKNNLNLLNISALKIDIEDVCKVFEFSFIRDKDCTGSFNAELQWKKHIGKQTTALRWISLSFFSSWPDKILVRISVLQSAFLTHNSRVPGNGLTDRGFQSQLVCFSPVGLMGNTGSAIRDSNLRCALY